MLDAKPSVNFFATSKKTPWSISKLNGTIKSILTELPSLWLVGEVSNLIKAKSGHYYFSLKDAKAQVPCAWFKGQQLTSNIQLKEGLSICVLAKPALYEPRGTYQLIIQKAEPIGEGALYQAFHDLKDKLNKEGLFSQKRDLPKFPKTIGVITSPTGAALRDIVAVLKRRYPCGKIIVYPAVVQGVAAPRSLVSALSQAIEHAVADVLILARGGGAYEDLIGFNDEELARLIVKSNIPTISGVGHEIDFTIADFVADARGATPSEAAAKCSPDVREINMKLINLQHNLEILANKIILHNKQKLLNLANRCKHPSSTLVTQQQTLDHLEQKMLQAFQQYLNNKEHGLELIRQNLLKPLLLQQFLNCSNLIKNLETQTQSLALKKIQILQLHLSGLINKLDGISPLKTLARGYAIVTDKENKIITNSKQLSSGDNINVQFQTGDIKAVVK